jgi:autoinducer 2-degrading protein
MLIVHVHVHVKEDMIEKFKKISIENAHNSIKEDEIARFDVIQQNDDKSKFVLNEVYKTAEAPAKHKETEHYKKWRDAVSDMMAEPRFSVKFTNLFPEDSDW